nr:unnamed protein product [Digitaria exilis]
MAKRRMLTEAIRSDRRQEYHAPTRVVDRVWKARARTYAGGEKRRERARLTLVDGLEALLLLVYPVGLHELELPALVRVPGRRHRRESALLRCDRKPEEKRRREGVGAAARTCGGRGGGRLAAVEEKEAERRRDERDWVGVVVSCRVPRWWGVERAGLSKLWLDGATTQVPIPDPSTRRHPLPIRSSQFRFRFGDGGRLTMAIRRATSLSDGDELACCTAL